jgi:hypothetical protein
MKPIATLVVVLVACFPLAAQVRHDLAGTWRLDPIQSAGPRPESQAPVLLVVQQDAGRLTMEHRTGEKSTTSIFSLDGSPSTTLSSIGRQAVGKARWEGDKLVIEGAEKTPSGGTLSLRVEIACSVDGSTLVITEIRDNGNTRFTSRSVFVKESAR